MALPKKSSRKIIVDENQYTWIATGNDDFIHLIITDGEINGQKLIAKFDYHSDEIVHADRVQVKQQLIITPYIVQQVIRYGLQNGWKPTDKGQDFEVGHLDDKIDIRINKQER